MYEALITLGLKLCSLSQQPAHKDLSRNGHSSVITFKATYAPIVRCFCLRSVLKRVHSRSNLRVRTLSLNGQRPAI
ncbi:hypothetical protein HMPREF0541_00968 [Lacticaseibacillus rhamnosus ATCC 21052]|nr:hypothetical protein HMPREF0541_00968 [Lacticaseibacillus rhamnosus ATCC 21052]